MHKLLSTILALLSLAFAQSTTIEDELLRLETIARANNHQQVQPPIVGKIESQTEENLSLTLEPGKYWIVAACLCDIDAILLYGKRWMGVDIELSSIAAIPIEVGETITYTLRLIAAQCNGVCDYGVEVFRLPDSSPDAVPQTLKPPVITANASGLKPILATLESQAIAD